MAKRKTFDTVLFFTTVTLVAGGFLIFISASLGLLAREGVQFSNLATSQFLFGITGGFIVLYALSHVPYRLYKKYALFVFTASLAATLLVFVPGVGLEFNGAKRWIDLGFTTFQPAEFLKIGYVLFLGVWLSEKKKRGGKSSVRSSFAFAVITGIVGLVLLLQPDTGTFLVLASAGGAMYVASGAKWRDIGALLVVGVLILSAVVFSRDYALERIETFLNPSADSLGAGFQIQQSLIAVGSGQLFGRGFGQSVQKFTVLPEPTSDSIFAVFAEEFGFLGSVVLIVGFMFFTLRALAIAARAPDMFGGLIVVGIAILVAAQSFLNIGSMLAVFPLTGLPLIFVSHGGSALLMSLAAVGIALNVSRSSHL